MTTHIDSQKLKTIVKEKDWDQLLQYVKPIHFVRQESETVIDATILAQICQILLGSFMPKPIIILCLKCLGNSCLHSYKHKQHMENRKSIAYTKNLYNDLVESDACKQRKDCDYPHDSHFPYNGIIEWTTFEIKVQDLHNLTDVDADIVRLSIQFLCNLFTYADVTSDNDVLRYLNCDYLKESILNCMKSHNRLLASAACIYVHNALKILGHDYFAMETNALCLQLLDPLEEGFESALDALLLLLHQPNVFEKTYNSTTINKRLLLLEIIYNEVWNSWQSDLSTVVTKDQAEFLALTFCKRGEAILMTINTEIMNSTDPAEAIFLINILGPLTAQYKISENDKCLLVTCNHLMMSLHIMGKRANNYFTPLTNMICMQPKAKKRTTNVCSSTNDTETTATIRDPREHPAYGFKAKLVQVIANLVHKNKMCQDLFREIDGIPLLLDCCNIDARNPFILQWTIFALRNLCEGNPENQEVIRSYDKIGVPNNPVLQEMGLTLHEDADGKSIRIAPLRRD